MHVTEYSIYYTGELPLSFILICDLHNRTYDGLFSAITSRSPSAVLFAGDFVENGYSYQIAFDFIQKTAKLYPTFCSLGNHEKLLKEEVVQSIIHLGAVLLDDKCIKFNGIYLGGLTSGTSYYPFGFKPPNTKWLKEFSQINGYKLLMCHHPEYYEKYIEELPIDLIVSGHAHGGQVRIFGQGMFAPGQGFFPKYTSGFHDERLIISRGLANTTRHIPRLWNKPEVVFIRLIPAF